MSYTYARGKGHIMEKTPLYFSVRKKQRVPSSVRVISPARINAHICVRLALIHVFIIIIVIFLWKPGFNYVSDTTVRYRYEYGMLSLVESALYDCRTDSRS